MASATTAYRTTSLASLGALVSSHPRRQGSVASSIAIVLIVFVAVPLAAAIALLLGSTISATRLALAAAIVLGTAFVARIGIRRTLRNKDDRVELHEHGVFQRWEGIDLAFAWEEVVAMRTTVHSVENETSFQFEVVLRDDRRVTVWSDTEHAVVLGKILQRDLLVALTHRIQEAFDRDESVRFGDIVAHASKGLVHEDRTLAWDDIERAAIEGGRVVIYARAGEHRTTWAELAFDRLDNASVFTLLANARGKTAKMLEVIDDPLVHGARNALRRLKSV